MWKRGGDRPEEEERMGVGETELEFSQGQRGDSIS